MRLTVNSLFAGAGGMDLGFLGAGFEIISAWDFDKFAVQSYAANIGDHIHLADVREMTWESLPPANVWTFGFSCQDLSVAGKRQGIRLQCLDCNNHFNIKQMDNRACPSCQSSNLKSFTRSGTFFEVMRLLEETRQNAPSQLPEIILAENVKPLKNYMDVLEEEYNTQGYKMFYQLYNSKYWGVPQSRERYYVVGIREDLGKDFKHPDQQTEFIPNLSSILQTDIPEKYYISDEKAKTIIEAAFQKIKEKGRELKEPVSDIQQFYIDRDGCAYCCDANYSKGTSAGDLGKGRRTQVIEPDIRVVGMLDIKGKDQWKRVFDAHGLSPTLTAVQGGMQEAKIFDQVKVRVRKLTPREYARLQGFPDTYTQVVSDSQFYKQMGNACTVPVVQAIATALRSQIFEEKED